MNTSSLMRIPMLLTGLVLAVTIPAVADQQKGTVISESSDVKATGKKKEAAPRLFAYKPPMRGKPGNRVGGGTRGTDKDMPVIAVLVPDHTGLTLRAQPVLYWYISQPTRYPIEFTLIDDRSIEPVLEVSLQSPAIPGIYSVQLSDYPVTLLQGIEYQWFVTVVRDREQRSKDIIATGMIKRIEPPSALRENISRADKTELPYIYSENGIWYDAVSSLSDLIRSDPGSREYLQMRKDLLDQTGLTEVVKTEGK